MTDATEVWWLIVRGNECIHATRDRALSDMLAITYQDARQVRHVQPLSQTALQPIQCEDRSRLPFGGVSRCHDTATTTETITLDTRTVVRHLCERCAGRTDHAR